MSNQIFRDSDSDRQFSASWFTGRVFVYSILLLWAFICLFPSCFCWRYAVAHWLYFCACCLLYLTVCPPAATTRTFPTRVLLPYCILVSHVSRTPLYFAASSSLRTWAHIVHLGNVFEIACLHARVSAFYFCAPPLPTPDKPFCCVVAVIVLLCWCASL